MKISKQVKHEVKQSPDQQMIINGQVAVVSGQPYSTFVCPTCGRILFQLQYEIPATQLAEAVSSLMPDFRNISFCPSCGEKLDYDICSVIDGIVLEDKSYESMDN